MSKEAMRLALEALEAHADIGIKSDKAITALREALAQDVPEVGFGNMALDKMAENARELGLDYEPAQQKPIKQGWDVDTLLDKPIPLKDFYKPAQQEPVAWMYQCSADSSGPVLMQHKRDWAESGSGLWTETPLYTSPPAQRTWVGLTFAEICECENDYLHIFARAIEAKLKERNT